MIDVAAGSFHSVASTAAAASTRGAAAGGHGGRRVSAPVRLPPAARAAARVGRVAWRDAPPRALAGSGRVLAWGAAARPARARRGVEAAAAPSPIDRRRCRRAAAGFESSLCLTSVGARARGLERVRPARARHRAADVVRARRVGPADVDVALTRQRRRRRAARARCGDYHALLLSSAGEVYAFGLAEYGRLGLGDGALPALAEAAPPRRAARRRAAPPPPPPPVVPRATLVAVQGGAPRAAMGRFRERGLRGGELGRGRHRRRALPLGHNGSGQLGLGDHADRSEPAVTPAPTARRARARRRPRPASPSCAARSPRTTRPHSTSTAASGAGGARPPDGSASAPARRRGRR